jgi:hypothetical protein
MGKQMKQAPVFVLQGKKKEAEVFSAEGTNLCGITVTIKVERCGATYLISMV